MEQGFEKSLSVVELRDGHVYVGVIKTFDAYNNIVLDHASERFTVKNLEYRGQVYPIAFADLYMGCMLLRGENIAVFGSTCEPAETYLNRLCGKEELNAPTSANSIAICVPLPDLLKRREEDNERLQHAREIWKAYKARLDLLEEGESMRDAFVKALLLEAQKVDADASFQSRDLEIIKNLFENYVRSARDALDLINVNSSSCVDHGPDAADW